MYQGAMRRLLNHSENCQVWKRCQPIGGSSSLASLLKNVPLETPLLLKRLTGYSWWVKAVEEIL